MQSTMFEDEITIVSPPARLAAVRSNFLPVYGVRLVRERREEYNLASMQIRCPQDIDRIARQLLEDMSREHLLVLLLDTKNQVRGCHVASVGILDSTLVHPREVFQAAILANAASIILCHNHPSGDPTPSAEDRRITTRISECGKLLGIDLLDHMVIGHDGRYVSLRERGLL